MKKEKKVMKNYRLRPDLVRGVNTISSKLNCSKTHILEIALENLIQQLVIEKP